MADKKEDKEEQKNETPAKAEDQGTVVDETKDKDPVSPQEPAPDAKKSDAKTRKPAPTPAPKMTEAMVSMQNMISAFSVNTPKPEWPNLKWIWKEGWDEYDEYMVSPHQDFVYRWKKGNLMPDFKRYTEFVVELQLRAVELAVKVLGVLRNKTIEDITYMDGRFSVVKENSVFASDAFRKSISQNTPLAVAWDKRQKSTARRVTNSTKAVVEEVEFRIRQYETFYPLDRLQLLIDPGIDKFVLSPNDVAELMKPFSTTFHEIKAHSGNVKKDFYLLPPKTSTVYLDEILETCPPARTWVHDLYVGLIDRIFEYKAADAFKMFNEVATQLQTSLTDTLPVNSLSSQLVAESSAIIFKRLMAAVICRNVVRVVFHPRLDDRDPMMLMGCFAYLCILPSCLVDPECAEECFDYVLQHHTNMYLRSTKKSPLFPSFTFNKQVPSHMINALAGMPAGTRNVIGAPQVADTLGLNCGTAAEFRNKVGNARGPIPDFFNMIFPKQGFPAPPGQASIVDGVQLHWFYEYMPGKPTEFIGKYKILLDYLAAVDRFPFQYSNNKEAGMYSGISRVMRGRAERFLGYAKAFTNLQQRLEMLDFAPKVEQNFPYDVNVNSLNLFSMLVNLNLSQVYIRPDFYDYQIFMNALRWDINTFNSLSFFAWNSPALVQLVDKDERIAVQDKILAKAKPWFCTEYIHKLVDLVKSDYKPRHFNSTIFSKAVNECLERVVANIENFGWLEDLYYIFESDPNVPQGFDYMKITDGSSNFPVTQMDRFELENRRSAIPKSALISYDVPWVKWELVFDSDSSADKMDDNLDEVLAKLRLGQQVTIKIRVRWNDITLEYDPIIKDFPLSFMVNFNPLVKMVPSMLSRGTKIQYFEVDDKNMLSKLDLHTKGVPLWRNSES